MTWWIGGVMGVAEKGRNRKAFNAEGAESMERTAEGKEREEFVAALRRPAPSMAVGLQWNVAMDRGAFQWKPLRSLFGGLAPETRHHVEPGGPSSPKR